MTYFGTSSPSSDTPGLTAIGDSASGFSDAYILDGSLGSDASGDFLLNAALASDTATLLRNPRLNGKSNSGAVSDKVQTLIQQIGSSIGASAAAAYTSSSASTVGGGTSASGGATAESSLPSDGLLA